MHRDRLPKHTPRKDTTSHVKKVLRIVIGYGGVKQFLSHKVAEDFRSNLGTSLFSTYSNSSPFFLSTKAGVGLPEIPSIGHLEDFSSSGVEGSFAYSLDSKVVFNSPKYLTHPYLLYSNQFFYGLDKEGVSSAIEEAFIGAEETCELKNRGKGSSYIFEWSINKVEIYVKGSSSYAGTSLMVVSFDADEKFVLELNSIVKNLDIHKKTLEEKVDSASEEPGVPNVVFPELVELYEQGELTTSKLVEHFTSGNYARYSPHLKYHQGHLIYTSTKGLGLVISTTSDEDGDLMSVLFGSDPNSWKKPILTAHNEPEKDNSSSE